MEFLKAFIIALIISLCWVSSIIGQEKSFTSESQKAKSQRQKKEKYESSTLLISTKTPGTLSFDNKYKKDIGINNVIEIKGVSGGSHSISFQTGSDSILKSITVENNQLYSFQVSNDTIGLLKQKKLKQKKSVEIDLRKYYLPKPKGYYFRGSFGLFSVLELFEPGTKYLHDITPLSSISFVNGYSFSPYLNLGIGAGITRYSYKIHYVSARNYNLNPTSPTFTLLPLYVQVGGDFIKKKITPIWYFQLGYSFIIKKPDMFLLDYSYAPLPEDEGRITVSNMGSTFMSFGFGIKHYILKSLAINYAFQFTGTSFKLHNNPAVDISSASAFGWQSELIIGISF